MDRLLPVFTEDQTRQLVAEARALLTACNGKPVPFRHQGRTLRGMDCIGMAVWCVWRLGFTVENRIDYGRSPVKQRMASVLQRHLGAPVAGPPRVGDFMTMSWGVAGDAHVVLVADHPHGLSLIHCAASIGRVVEHRLTDEYQRLVTNIYRP